MYGIDQRQSEGIQIIGEETHETSNLLGKAA